MNRSKPMRAIPDWARAIALLSPALVILAKGASVLDGPFEYGEYFASAVGFFDPTRTGLTLHGALDFIPAIVARAVWGAERYFLPTEAIYKLLDLFAAGLLIAIAARFAQGQPDRHWRVLGLALAAPYLVGYRDLFLLAALLTFLLLGTQARRSAVTLLGQVLLGMLVAINVYWSYDRGIAGAAALGAATLYRATRDRSHLVSLGTFVVTVAIIARSNAAFSIATYLQNVIVLAQTSSQWSYGLNRHTAVLSAFALGLNLLALWRYGSGLARQKPDRAAVAEGIAFTILAIILLKAGLNRADHQHVYWSLWVPLLILLRLTPSREAPPRSVWIGFAALASISLLLAARYDSYVFPFAAACLADALLASVMRVWPQRLLQLSVVGGVLSVAATGYDHHVSGEYRWTTEILRPPSNADVSPIAMRWAAHELTASGTSCIFDMTNSGLLNGLANLPSCSRFVYPIYAGAQHEAELIEAVRTQRPTMIVYSSTDWPYRIDDKPMNLRFPSLDRFLRDTYPIEICRFGYCLRTQPARMHFEN